MVINKSALHFNATTAYKSGNVPNPPPMSSRILKYDSYGSTDVGERSTMKLFANNNEFFQHIEDGRQITAKYQQHFNDSATIEETFTLYEKGRDDILKTYAGDSMLQVHLDVFDNAFKSHMQFLACNAAMVLRNEQTFHTYGVEGQHYKFDFEFNKIATNTNFDSDEFQKNAVILMTKFAESYIQQIKSGVSYDLAHRNATEYMTANFSKTTSVNNLSFNDFSFYLEVISKESSESITNPNIWKNFHAGALGEKNNIFNNSMKITEELMALFVDNSEVGLLVSSKETSDSLVNEDSAESVTESEKNQKADNNNSFVSNIIKNLQSTERSSSFNYIATNALKQALAGLMSRIEMLQGDMYTASSWSKLMKTYGGAKGVYMQEPPNEQSLNRTLRNLTCDFTGLKRADPDGSSVREKLPLVLPNDTSNEQAVEQALQAVSVSAPMMSGADVGGAINVGDAGNVSMAVNAGSVNISV